MSALVTYCCIAGVCVLIGLWSYYSKRPMNFIGIKRSVKMNEIQDVIGYNKECAVLWFIYGTCFAISGILLLFGNIVLQITGGFILPIAATYILRLLHEQVYKKHKYDD